MRFKENRDGKNQMRQSEADLGWNKWESRARNGSAFSLCFGFCGMN